MLTTPAAGSAHVRAKMQAQKSKDTKPEVALRSELHRRGVRFRKSGALPGMPRRSADITWVGRKVAVFVDGCYWHGCPEHFHTPKTNTDWWLAKIGTNQARDAKTTEALEAAGWTVVRVWEHEGPVEAADRVQTALARAAERRSMVVDVPSDLELEDSSAALAAALLEPSRRFLPGELNVATRDDNAGPGLYALWVDAHGARDMTERVGCPVEAGLLYVGQAGAQAPGERTAPRSTLADWLRKNHFKGPRDKSTVRRSLWAALASSVTPLLSSEKELTEWMRRHLQVSVVPVLNRADLFRLEPRVLRRLDPPMNWDHLGTTPLRETLHDRRSRSGRASKP